MIRTIRYEIQESDLNGLTKLTVKGFLKCKFISTQSMKVLKQTPGGILRNDEETHLNAPLSPGDTLTLNILEDSCSESILPVDLPLDIVYEDQDLLVINKPAGMPIHPSQNNRDNSLANALAYHYLRLGQPFVFRCINRLDRDTSGLTLIARHMVSAGILGTQVAAKAGSPHQTPMLSREYLAIVRGIPNPPAGTIDVPLGRRPGSVIERTVDFQHGERAVTHYRVLETKNGHSLISLILETGRTHQIRIHMKYLGYPLVGDYLYNPDYEYISRQALHSHRLTFNHPITGERMSFSAPLAKDMAEILQGPRPHSPD